MSDEKVPWMEVLVLAVLSPLWVPAMIFYVWILCRFWWASVETLIKAVWG